MPIGRNYGWPEKDVQWSDEGIISSFKFIQKLWNLNKSISEEIAKKHPKNSNNEIDQYTNKFIKKITHNLENFNYNIVIANLHELYSFLSKAINQEYTKETLTINYKKIFNQSTKEALDSFKGKKILIGRARMFEEKTKDLDDPGMFALHKLTEAF